VTVDPRTPVLVGAASATQRTDDPRTAREAVGLMVAACEAAAADAGRADLLRAAGLVLTPRGTWRYQDPGRLVADRVGASGARTLLADLGILQTTLIARAAAAITAGDVDVALVVGGEAKWRDLRASITGVAATSTDDTGATPDEVIRPEGMIISAEEIGAGLVTAVSQYALVENARRRADGQTLDEHARAVAALWAGFNEVARSFPGAWNRQPMSADDIRLEGPGNRPLAFPYNKWHNAQWNVDQAACLVLCSVAAARSHGVPEERWVFPHAVAESNHIVPVSRRAVLHRSPGFAAAGAEALGSAGVGVDDLAHLDLYSCFPIAVRVQAAELGIGPDRTLTVTGGMTFGGGPLNNYVLQSTARMAQVLREDPGSLGLVTAVSGLLTKQGVSVWSSRPPAAPCRVADVSERAAAATPAVDVVTGREGPATVATYTVRYGEDGAPTRAVALVDLADGPRAIAVSGDPGLASAMTAEEFCGRTVDLDDGGGFSVRG